MSLNEIIERFTLVSGYERKEISRYLPIIRDCMDLFEERISCELTEIQRRLRGIRLSVHQPFGTRYRRQQLQGGRRSAGDGRKQRDRG